MRNNGLHEVAKFAAGLVAADFFWLLWFSQQHVKSAVFFGATVTQDMVLPMMIFDIAVFILLVHYAWNVGTIPHLRERGYMLIAGAIFTVVAAAHVWRIFANADLVIMDWTAPLWLSWIGVAVAAYLAYTSFHLAARLRKNRS
ncbi:MAG: hypothetical protein Q7R71_00195 [bacterium]|nr:hypothetical protein [bacterium]